MGITSYWWPLCSKTPSMHAKLAFRIPHFTHHSAADFRTVHSAFRILPGPVHHRAMTNQQGWWHRRLSISRHFIPQFKAGHYVFRSFNTQEETGWPRLTWKDNRCVIVILNLTSDESFIWLVCKQYYWLWCVCFVDWWGSLLMSTLSQVSVCFTFMMFTLLCVHAVYLGTRCIPLYYCIPVDSIVITLLVICR